MIKLKIRDEWVTLEVDGVARFIKNVSNPTFHSVTLGIGTRDILAFENIDIIDDLRTTKGE